jgi:hypothetical protein
MSYLNRSAITVTRKQPYTDWANREAEAEARADGEAAPLAFADELPRTVYVVGPAVPSGAIEELLDDFWETIFQEELAAWTEDEASWPSLSRELFDEWFAWN